MWVLAPGSDSIYSSSHSDKCEIFKKRKSVTSRHSKYRKKLPEDNQNICLISIMYLQRNCTCVNMIDSNAHVLVMTLTFELFYCMNYQ